jgi:hypothetical protein
MVECLMKTDVPQATLDTIQHERMIGHGNKRSYYEFNIVINVQGMPERLQFFTTSHDVLKQWVIGINALIQNKNNLMRLSTMIKN